MPKISALPAIGTPQLTDITPEVQPATGGTTYKTTYQQIFNLFNANGMAVLPPAASDNLFLLSKAAGNPVWSSGLNNGQLLIGSTGAAPVAANLSAGSGISINNAAGSITISSSTSGLGWFTVTSTSQTLIPDSGFVINSASLCTLRLPSTAFVGSSIYVFGLAGGWTIVENSGQSIIASPYVTTPSSGALSSAANTDAVHLICIVQDTIWSVSSCQTTGFIIS